MFYMRGYFVWETMPAVTG